MPYSNNDFTTTDVVQLLCEQVCQHIRQSYALDSCSVRVQIHSNEAMTAS